LTGFFAGLLITAVVVVVEERIRRCVRVERVSLGARVLATSRVGEDTADSVCRGACERFDCIDRTLGVWNRQHDEDGFDDRPAIVKDGDDDAAHHEVLEEATALDEREGAARPFNRIEVNATGAHVAGDLAIALGFVPIGFRCTVLFFTEATDGKDLLVFHVLGLTNRVALASFHHLVVNIAFVVCLRAGARLSIDNALEVFVVEAFGVLLAAHV